MADPEEGLPPSIPKEQISAEEAEAAEKQRKADLRRAGEDFLNRAVQASKQGQDPFNTATNAKKSKPTAKAGAHDVSDPEFEAFGQLFEGTKSYAFMGLYLLCQSSSYVLVKVQLVPRFSFSFQCAPHCTARRASTLPTQSTLQCITGIAV